MPHQDIKQFEVGQKVTDYYLVKSKRAKTTRTNKTYLDLDLGDRTGQVNAKVWDAGAAMADSFGRGDVVKIQATVDEYQGTRQLNITRIRPVQDGDAVVMSDLLKSSPYNPEELMAYVSARIEEIEDQNLHRLLAAFFDDADLHAAFMIAPAARNVHHAYMGGLLEHTVKVLKTALFAADELYPGVVDRDLLTAGAIFHDIGKVRELDLTPKGGYTTAGYLLGHITLAADLIHQLADRLPEFPPELLLELEHIIVAHHGEKEFGSPAVPMTPEAMIIHMADNLDAKTQIALAAIAEDPNRDEDFTEYHRTLARHFYKSSWRKSEGGGE
jgi:3'-5' exoribonuclease